MSKKLFLVVLALGVCMVFALTALSQVKPDVLVKQRQAAMTLQAKYFGPLVGMAQGKVPYNSEVVSRNAGYLTVLTKLAWDGFDPSTAAEKTGALPAVYTDKAKFKTASEELQAAVAKLASTSKKKDEAATKAAIGAVGKTCGACHDTFRQKT